jgi:hypothetical protein
MIMFHLFGTLLPSSNSPSISLNKHHEHQSMMVAVATTQSHVPDVPDVPPFFTNFGANADGDAHAGNNTPNKKNDSSKNAAAKVIGNEQCTRRQ